MLASNPAKTDPAFSSVFAAFRGWLRNRKLMRRMPPETRRLR